VFVNTGFLVFAVDRLKYRSTVQYVLRVVPLEWCVREVCQQTADASKHSSPLTTKMRCAVKFFVALLLVAFAYVYSFKGYVVNGITAQTISSESYVDVNNLLLTVVTTVSGDKLILTVMLAVQFASPNGWMKFNILRNGMPLSSTSLRFVRSTYSSEAQPVVISVSDWPGPVNSYTYKVQAAGYGDVGNGARNRQFSCIQMPGSTPGAYATFTGKVYSSSSTLTGLTQSVTPSSTTDKVLVFLNMDATNVTSQDDFNVQLSRAGGIVLAPTSKFGYANSISTPLGTLDSPSTTASVAYSPLITRSVSSQAVLCGGGSSAQLYAYVIPAGLTASTATSTSISVTSVLWTYLGLSVTITPLTTTDKVMLMFNADLIFTAGPPYQLGITIFRDWTNLGDPTYGLHMINAGSVQYSRRSPMMMFMDSPGVTSATTYAVYAYTNGPSITAEFGRGGLESSFVALLVTEGPAPTASPTRSPTAAPSAGPTRSPTAPPTTAPTLSPTAAPTLTPTAKPTATPSVGPTAAPSANPTLSPSASPTVTPSASPTAVPTTKPTLCPTLTPSATPTLPPSASPTQAPTAKPSLAPTSKPTVTPTTPPSAKPSLTPTRTPTALPSASPTPAPTSTPARWAGASRTLTSDLVLSSDGFVDTGLELTVTTTVTDEKVVIMFMASVEFTAAHQYMQFRVLCDDEDVYGSSVRYVRADRAGELAPVLFTFADNPETPRAYSFRVLAAGYGILGAAGRMRTLTVLQVPATVSADLLMVGGLVTPPDNWLGLTASVSLNSAADAVFLMASVDAVNATLQTDLTLRFICDGYIEIGTEASFGSASGVSTPVGMLDWPGRSGLVQYEVNLHRASAASTAVVGGAGTQRTMYALVVPAGLCRNTAISDELLITGASFGEIGLSTWVATTSAADKVLLTFNADLLITRSRVVDDAPAVKACFSFMRNGVVLLGDANNGLLCISPGSVSSARRSPMMVYLDSPYFVGQVTYSVAALNSAQEQYDFELGHGSVESSITAIVLNGAEVPTYSPTAAPTVRPSARPSAVPTLLPTPAPTVAPSARPSAVPTLSPTPNPTPAPTSAPTSAPTTAPSASHTIAPTAAPSAAPTACPTAFPTKAPTVIPTAGPSATPSAGPTAAPTAGPSAGPSVVPTTTPSVVPTTAPSAPPTAGPSPTPTTVPTTDPTNNPSAEPSLDPTKAPRAYPSPAPSTAPTSMATTLMPTAKPTAAPTAGPTASGADCSVSCQIAGGVMFQVYAGQSLGTYRLSTFFTLYFQMYNPAAWPTAQVYNILKMYDSISGENLLSIGMSYAPQYVEVIYGSTQVIQYASLFAYNYQTVLHGLTFTVDAAGFSIFSDQTGYALTVPVPYVETYGRAYTMYVSYPGWTSSGGYIQNMQFQSKWVPVGPI
jgi:hypothetical protein